jgi:hypothetical protein
MMAPLDRQLAARAALLTLLLASLALLILAFTDEIGSTWGDRLVRLAALAPALAGLAAAVLARQLRARGEALALALTGASPTRSARGLALGGALVGAPASILGVLLAPSLRALLPVVAASPWIASASGFLAPTLGLRLEPPGGPVQFLDAVPGAAHPPERWALAAALALASLLAPWWAALPCPALPRVATGTAATLGAIVTFHAIALGAPASLLLLPCAVLAAHLRWLTSTT